MSLPRLFIRIEGEDSETVLVPSERAYRIGCDVLFRRRAQINSLVIGRITYHCGNGKSLRYELNEQDDLPLMPDAR